MERLSFIITANLVLLAIVSLYASTSFSQITEVSGSNGTSGGGFNVFLKERHADMLAGNRGVFISYGDLVELGGAKKSGSCFICGRTGVESQNGDAGQIEGRAESPSGGSYSGANGGAGGDGEDEDDNKDVRLLKEDKQKEMSFLMGIDFRVYSYLMVRVKGRMVEALVDSGSKMTIMSKSFMESCRLAQYCDYRWRGCAKGIGTAVVLGRIHCLIMEVFSNGQYVSVVTDVRIMNATSVSDRPFIIGLNFLKRFHAVMDYKSNKLKLNFDERHRLYK